MILFVPACTRDNLERRKDSHDEESRAPAAAADAAVVALRECACMCDVANDDRCVDGTGVGGYGSYGWRRGRCVPRSRWPYTSPGSHDLPCTLYTHKVPFSWISFFGPATRPRSMRLDV